MIIIKRVKKYFSAKIKALGVFGGAFAGLGALGAFGACHTLCQIAIAFLAIFGITVIGMPLAFLQEPIFIIIFTSIGVASIALSVRMYLKMKKQCGIKNKKARK